MRGGYWTARDRGTVVLDDAPARYCVDADVLYFEHTSSGEPHLTLYERE